MKEEEKLTVRTTNRENNCECEDWDWELKREWARQAGNQCSRQVTRGK